LRSSRGPAPFDKAFEWVYEEYREATCFR